MTEIEIITKGTIGLLNQQPLGVRSDGRSFGSVHSKQCVTNDDVHYADLIRKYLVHLITDVFFPPVTLCHCSPRRCPCTLHYYVC